MSAKQHGMKHFRHYDCGKIKPFTKRARLAAISYNYHFLGNSLPDLTGGANFVKYS
jgi:hypothetical protein